MVSQFATNSEHIEESFSHVMREIDADVGLKASILPKWIEAHQSGDPRRESKALSLLQPANWEWPELKDWQQAFSQSERWPYMWKKFDCDTGMTNVARIGLLAHLLTMSAYRCRDFHKGKGRKFAQLGWRLPSIGCPVEDEIAAAMKETVDLNVWQTWPPFFPGDRICLHVEARNTN